MVTVTSWRSIFPLTVCTGTCNVVLMDRHSGNGSETMQGEQDTCPCDGRCMCGCPWDPVDVEAEKAWLPVDGGGQ